MGSSGRNAAVVDTAANLAAANTVYPVGTFIRSSDSHVLAFADGSTAYNSLPKYEEKLDPQIAESSTQQTGITTGTALTGLTVSFTVGTIPWMVELVLPYVYTTTSGDLPVAAIADGSGTFQRQTTGVKTDAATFFHGPLIVREYISTPGSYTRKGYALRLLGSGAVVVGAADALYTAQLIARPFR